MIVWASKRDLCYARSKGYKKYLSTAFVPSLNKLTPSQRELSGVAREIKKIFLHDFGFMKFFFRLHRGEEAATIKYYVDVVSTHICMDSQTYIDILIMTNLTRKNISVMMLNFTLAHIFRAYSSVYVISCSWHGAVAVFQ